MSQLQKSSFVRPLDAGITVSRNLEGYDGILDYVERWLDHDAKSKNWKATETDQNLLKLFLEEGLNQ